MQVLLALVPYTRQNMLLAFHPDRFFTELEKSTDYSQSTLREAYRRIQKDNLVVISDSTVRLTTDGERSVRPFTAEKLTGGAELMVIFDIPESQAHIRRQFRSLLIELKFVQIQRSVWTTGMDHRAMLHEIVDELNAHDWVKIYEAAPIS
jgi:DNA-binding transcriptional regulator PaaX